MNRPAVGSRLGGRFACKAICLVTVILLSGCTTASLITYSTDMPAVALLPASHTTVTDGRGRFREVYCNVQRERGEEFPDNRPCEDVIVRLPGEVAPAEATPVVDRPKSISDIAFVPGIYSQCFIERLQPLWPALDHMKTLGYHTHFIETRGTDSVSNNAQLVRDAVVAMNLPADARLLLVGYSKGAAEVLESVTRFEEVRANTAAVLTISGAVAGSPIADLLSTKAGKALPNVNVGECNIEHSAGVESVTRRRRVNWLAANELPASIAYFSLIALPEPRRVPRGLWLTYELLAHVDPRNDGLVLSSDAVVPGSTLLGYVNTDHWNIVHRFPRELHRVTGEGFPQEVMVEASVRYIEAALDAGGTSAGQD